MDEFSVRIKKMAFEDAKIPVMIFDQRDSSYNAFGYIYLNVLKKDKEKAIELLKLLDE